MLYEKHLYRQILKPALNIQQAQNRENVSTYFACQESGYSDMQRLLFKDKSR